MGTMERKTMILILITVVHITIVAILFKDI